MKGLLLKPLGFGGDLLLGNGDHKWQDRSLVSGPERFSD